MASHPSNESPGVILVARACPSYVLIPFFFRSMPRVRTREGNGDATLQKMRRCIWDKCTVGADDGIIGVLVVASLPSVVRLLVHPLPHLLHLKCCIKCLLCVILVSNIHFCTQETNYLRFPVFLEIVTPHHRPQQSSVTDSAFEQRLKEGGIKAYLDPHKGKLM